MRAFLTFLILFALAPIARAGSAPLDWAASIFNTDGSALTDLAGYRIYADGSLAMSPGAGVTHAVVDNLAPGVHSFTLTAFNAAGTESAQTNAVTITVVDTLPVCGSMPPPETRLQTCPAPTIGSFTQAHGWTSVAAPACWQATPWTPDTAPAGVCALPALLTAGPYGYESTGTVAAPTMSSIGLVPTGTPCGPATKIIGTTKFCQIALSQLDVVIWPVDRTLAKGVWAKVAP